MVATAPRKSPASGGRGAAPVLAAGTLLAGRYRLERVLARGGMGEVVAARHEQLGHRVAIKLLLPGVLDETATRRVLREGRALASLASAHVTRILDVGELDSGAPFIVMELLEGEDLARVLARDGKLPLETAASYLVQAADAISEAHARGIVHRDLKPSNLFLTRARDGAPFIKLLDFGISRPLGADADDSLTTTHATLGTPEFMSPEQYTGSRDIDPRADVWSLGVVLFHLLTGRPIFGKNRSPALEIGLAGLAPPRLRQIDSSLPEAVDALVSDCLKKDRDKRPPSVAAFVARLIAFAEPETRRRYQHLVDEGPAWPSSQPPRHDEAPADPDATAQTLMEPEPRRRSKLWLAAILVAGGAAALGIGLARRPRAEPAVPLPVGSAPTLPQDTAAAPLPSIAPSVSAPAAAPAALAPAKPRTERVPARPSSPSQNNSAPSDPYGQRR